jgi:malate dehydrogenase (oxaloacetate-decarboxylating)
LRILREPYVGHGKLEVLPKVVARDLQDIALLYTPGVGYAVKEILARPEALGELTGRDNTIAVVTDGSAVLGLGRAGPRAALPVMEGKASMFKLLVGIDAIPLCLDVRNPQQVLEILEATEPSFGGYNLEDIAAPHCFDIMEQAPARLTVPIIHDDQYGTATVVIAALLNAFKLLGRDVKQQRVVVCGDGAAGTATARLLKAFCIGDVLCVGLDGIIHRRGRYVDAHRRWLAQETNCEGIQGDLLQAMEGADVFIGLSVANLVTPGMVRRMRPHPVVLSLANPVPEIMPEDSLAGGAAIVGSGRFDYPNQCNNVLAFPGLMRGALDCGAVRVDHDACLAAARAIAGDVPESELRPDNILPTPLSSTLYPSVSEAVAQDLVVRNLARRQPPPGAVAAHTSKLRTLVAERQAFVSARTPKYQTDGVRG